MFAINHAATALIIKKRYPETSLVWLLLSVQLVEILWVVFNFLGIERTSTEAAVTSVSDIHLAHMPFSHSLASSLLLALVAWLGLAKLYKRPVLAVAVAVGIMSHVVLDIVTHTRDISIVPWLSATKIGLGLYAVPPLAFAVETAYGLFCWWLFRGSKALFVAILAFNLANISFFFAALHGPETLMAGHSSWLVGAVALQITVTLILVGWLAKPRLQRFTQQAA